MHLAFFLHIYQPPTQLAGVTEKIAQDSYIKLLTLLEESSKSSISLNMNASLTEQLAEKGYADLLTRINKLAEKGSLELTSSAAYHAFLPNIPKEEIYRQVELNRKINTIYLGESYETAGFFPPEMAYSRRLVPLLESLRFKWLVLDETALKKPTEDNVRRPFEKLFKIKNSNLTVFFRHNRLSLDIAFGKISSLDQFLSAVDLESDGYMILAMDGETFGHHRPEQLDLLREIFAYAEENSNLTLCTISDLIESSYTEEAVIDPLPSTWGPKTRWNNPDNLLHRLQWQLTNLAVSIVRNSEYAIKGVYLEQYLKDKDLSDKQKQWVEARLRLDKALHSDQYFWAGGDPVWHPELVKRGTGLLVSVVEAVPEVSKLKVARAKQLAERIIANGLRKHGSEVIVS